MESMDESLKLEHPVTVVYEDEQNSDDGLEKLDGKRLAAEPARQKRRDNRTWSVRSKKLTQEDDVHNERTIEISIFNTKNSEQGHNSCPSPSSSSLSSSPADSDTSLVQVSVIVDDDNDVKRRRHRDVSHDAASSEDDVTSEVFPGDVIEAAVDGHVTKREMEVVEHETTRKCVILAPNTKLDSSDDEEGKGKEEGFDDVIAPFFDWSAAYEEAADLYRKSMRGQRSALVPVVVFRTDAETQTNRSRTTQTGIDRSVQTDPRRTTRRLNLEEHPTADGNQPSSPGHEAQDEGRTRTGRNRRTVVRQQEPNNVSIDSSRVKFSHFGQQTPCHTSTQTPVLVRLDARGRLWMSDDVMSASTLFRNLCLDNSRLTLGSYVDQRCHHSNAETQTTSGCHGDGILDDCKDVGRNSETREKLETLKQTQKRDDNCAGKIEEDDVAAKENGKQGDPVDESRKQLLQLMLREIKRLRKKAAEMKSRDTHAERERSRHADKDSVKSPRLDDNTNKKHATNGIVSSKENAHRDGYYRIDKGYRNYRSEIYNGNENRRRKLRRDTSFRHQIRPTRRTALPDSGGHSGGLGFRRSSISEDVELGDPDSPTVYPGGPSDLDRYRRYGLDVKGRRHRKTGNLRHLER